MQIPGMLTIEDLRNLVEQSRVDTVLLTFTDIYGRQFGKRLDARFFLEGGETPGTHACDYLLTTDMEMDPSPGYRFANWERGYGDFHMLADMSTLRFASWLDRTALVTCDVLQPNSHAFVEEAPRSILRRSMTWGAATVPATAIRHAHPECGRKPIAAASFMGASFSKAASFVPDFVLTTIEAGCSVSRGRRYNRYAGLCRGPA